MIRKNNMWDIYASWEAAEKDWDDGCHQAAQQSPLKTLRHLPSVPSIAESTAKNLKWKSLRWMLFQDKQGEVRKGFFRHPLKYGRAFLKSIFQRKPYLREGDFFLYGVDDLHQFQETLTKPDTLLVLGFSYCQKPHECPSGRFSPECIHDPHHQVCRQCFIGKAINALPVDNAIPLAIPTVHYIGGKIFEIVHGNPDKEVVFMITACEMTLEMFGDWGNMVGIKGVGIRLAGRFCNTMRAFALSETGVKPGLTILHEETQRQLFRWIRLRRESAV